MSIEITKKKTWEILRTLLPSKNNSLTPNLITVNNSPISNLNGITEEFSITIIFSVLASLWQPV